MDVSPRVLRYFMAVVGEQHFGRAAARLFISQPSLSQQIRKLEQTIGTPLFVRSPQGVQLTVAGRTLAGEAPAALAALDRAVRLAQLAASGVTTTIRLGYTPVASFDVLTTLVNALQEDHPDMVVDAQECFSAEIPNLLCSGELDIGIALSPPSFEGVHSEVLRRDTVSAVLSGTHRLAATSAIAVSDLIDETLLLFPRQLAPAYYDSIVATCRHVGFEPHVQMFSDPPVTAMLARLHGGRQVGLAPTSFAEYAARASTGLLSREVVGPPIPATFFILWSADDPALALARVLETVRRYAFQNSWLEVHDESTPDRDRTTE